MGITDIFEAVAGSGAWGLLAVFLIKYFIDDKAKTIDRLEKIHKESQEYMRMDKEKIQLDNTKLMDVAISQNNLLIQQKDILKNQTELLSHNAEMMVGIEAALDKITDIQTAINANIKNYILIDSKDPDIITAKSLLDTINIIIK